MTPLLESRESEGGIPTLSEVFTRVCELALLTEDGRSIKDLPGAWQYAFRDGSGHEWKIAVNGHAESVASPLQEGATILPFDAHIYFNGWPFAMLDPFGRGVIGAGEGANEDACIAALIAEAERRVSPPLCAAPPEEREQSSQHNKNEDHQDTTKKNQLENHRSQDATRSASENA